MRIIQPFPRKRPARECSAKSGRWFRSGLQRGLVRLQCAVSRPDGGPDHPAGGKPYRLRSGDRLLAA